MCDLAILYNGAHRAYRPVLARLRARGAATLMVELGWLPQTGHYQVDPQGVNASASWANEPLEVEGNTPLPLRRTSDLLLLMQLDCDTQITEHSSHFASMEGLIRFVSASSELPVRVRPHPKSNQNVQLRGIAEACGAKWDSSESLAESFASARAVACINSSAGMEAMAAGLPVLCYGKAMYRHAGAVYCLGGDPHETRSVTAELARGECSLVEEKVKALVRRVVEKQWTIAQVPQRLPELVEGLLARTPSISPHLTSNDRVERTIYWFADLPAKLLYRRRLRPAVS